MLYLAARDTAPGRQGRPRRLAPAALRRRPASRRCCCATTPSSARPYEVDYPAVFADSAKYLAAAAEAANDRKLSADDLAQEARARRGLPEALDRRAGRRAAPRAGRRPGRTCRRSPLDCWTRRPEERQEAGDQRLAARRAPTCRSWSRTPRTRSSTIPGRVSPHGVAVHPTPKEFVAVAWKSPLAGKVRVAGQGGPRPPGLRQRRRLVARTPPRRTRRPSSPKGRSISARRRSRRRKTLKVEQGRPARPGRGCARRRPPCDLTEIAFTVTETDKPGRVWDLAADVADNVLDGNPHADKHGNKDVWSFVRGASKRHGRRPGRRTDPAGLGPRPLARGGRRSRAAGRGRASSPSRCRPC